MFERTKATIKEYTNKIFGRNKDMMPIGQDNKINNKSKVKEWVRIYEDKPFWRSRTVRGSNLPAAMVSELAKRVTVEIETSMLHPHLEPIAAGHARLISKSRSIVEQLLVQGSGLMIPLEYEDEYGSRTFEVSYIPALNFNPIKFNELDELIEVEVYELAEYEGKTYTRVENHSYDRYSKTHTVTNKLYKGDLINVRSAASGSDIPLATVPDFIGVEREVVVPYVNKPLFVYVKTPFTNNVNSNSPLGVSLYSKVESLLREYDEAYTSYITELKAKRVRIDTPTEIAEGMLESEPADSPLRDIIYPIPVMSEEALPALATAGLIGVYSPDIREVELAAGMEKLLRKIEFNAGFAYGDLSEAAIVEKTATEIKMAKQRSQSTVEDVQIEFDKALRAIAEAMFELAVFYGEISGDFDSKTDLSIIWGDGVSGDREKDMNVMMMMVEKGMLKGEIAISEFFKCSVEEARMMMPSLAESPSKTEEV